MQFSPAQMRSIRKAAGVSRAELAREVGRDKLTIRAYECGRWNPPLHVAAKIAATLGVSLDALFETTDQPEAMTHG